jgi:hypothetical protein
MTTSTPSGEALTTRCLRAFPLWLDTLGEDALLLDRVTRSPSCPEPLRELLDGAALALSRGLQLIPQEIADVAYLELALLLRIAVALGLEESGQELSGLPELHALRRLAADASLLHEVFGRDTGRLERRVRALSREARGLAALARQAAEKAPEGIEEATAATDADEAKGEMDPVAETRRALEAWASRFSPPPFAEDETNLVKLQAFLLARLPT